MKLIHIVVAAGSGTRFGSNLPKQFCLLGGRPVLMWAIDALRAASPEADFVVVVSPSMSEFWAELCRDYNYDSPRVCLGGGVRWESVKNALTMLDADGSLNGDTIVGIHDGARPLVAREVVSQACEAIEAGAGAAIPAVAVTDSLRELVGEGESRSVDRSRFRAVQTPQMFRADRLWQAYRCPYRSSYTDDASVYESAGYTDLVLTPGDPTNIKITNPRDLFVAEALMRSE